MNIWIGNYVLIGLQIAIFVFVSHPYSLKHGAWMLFPDYLSVSVHSLHTREKFYNLFFKCKFSQSVHILVTNLIKSNPYLEVFCYVMCLCCNKIWILANILSDFITIDLRNPGSTLCCKCLSYRLKDKAGVTLYYSHCQQLQISKPTICQSIILCHITSCWRHLKKRLAVVFSKHS